MPTSLGPCRNCGHDVAVTTTCCRSCGYDADPERTRRGRFVNGILGSLLTLTLVGAPFGIPLLYRSLTYHRAHTRGVVETAHPSTTGLAGVVDGLQRSAASLVGPRNRQS